MLNFQNVDAIFIHIHCHFFLTRIKNNINKMDKAIFDVMLSIKSVGDFF